MVPREADEQGVDVFLARGVGDQRLDAPAQLLTRMCDSLGVPAGDDDPRAFVPEELRGSKSNAGRSASDQRNPAVELSHRSLRNVTV